MSAADAAAGPAIVWFRRDLRVDDNPALVAALQASPVVIPLFIWSPEEEGQFQPGRCSKWWFKQSLIKFQLQIAALGSRLILRRSSDSVQELLSVVKETKATSVHFNHLFDPISLVRDHSAKQLLAECGVTCRSYNADLLYDPWDVLDEQGEPFTCFRSFWDSVCSMPRPPQFPFPPPPQLPAVPDTLHSLEPGDLGFFSQRPEQEAASEQLGFKWHPGPEGGMARLEAFLSSQLESFSHDKANVDRSITSRLSPWIHTGTISVRFLYYRVVQQQQAWVGIGEDHAASCSDFLQQLGYREYSRYLSFHFPFITERSLLAHLRAVPWRLDVGAFKAWRLGLTGYPLIDAGMKELWATGWMHNRLRLVCGAFLVKHLLLPWQWGLKHFWDCFLDADLESDALGWQYLAGCMSDAPEFRLLMDIESESAKFDPDGEFIRRWLPALARMPTQYIHAPWKAPGEVLAAADVELGVNYSYPIVDAAAAWEALQEAAAVVDASLEATEQLEEGAGEVAEAAAAATAPLAVAAAGGGAGPGGDVSGAGSGHLSGGSQQQGSGQQQQRGRPHPFRPPTQPRPSLSLALLSAKEQGSTCLQPYAVDTDRHFGKSTAAAAAAAVAAAGAGTYVPSAAAAAAAAAGGGPASQGTWGDHVPHAPSGSTHPVLPPTGSMGHQQRQQQWQQHRGSGQGHQRQPHRHQRQQGRKRQRSMSEGGSSRSDVGDSQPSGSSCLHSAGSGANHGGHTAAAAAAGGGVAAGSAGHGHADEVISSHGGMAAPAAGSGRGAGLSPAAAGGGTSPAAKPPAAGGNHRKGAAWVDAAAASSPHDQQHGAAVVRSNPVEVLRMLSQLHQQRQAAAVGSAGSREPAGSGSGCHLQQQEQQQQQEQLAQGGLQHGRHEHPVSGSGGTGSAGIHSGSKQIKAAGVADPLTGVGLSAQQQQLVEEQLEGQHQQQQQQQQHGPPAADGQPGERGAGHKQQLVQQHRRVHNHHNIHQQQYHDGGHPAQRAAARAGRHRLAGQVYGLEEESEVFSNLPATSEQQPTACSVFQGRVAGRASAAVAADPGGVGSMEPPAAAAAEDDAGPATEPIGAEVEVVHVAGPG